MNDGASAASRNPPLSQVEPGQPGYPAGLLAAFGVHAPALSLRGNPALLDQPAVAVFSSVRCPGGLILRAFDLARAWRAAGAIVAGGFQSPAEQECLRILLPGAAGVVWWLARPVAGARLSPDHKHAVEDGRLLLVADASLEARRPSVPTAARRNLLCAAASHSVLIIHAHPGGHTEALCRQALAWGKPVYAVKHPANAHLAALGVRFGV
jgi:predicted Rossmann fold nucleotide-binding protein DprA/Smf involved in DNA uptake